MQKSIRVLIADDHPVVLLGLEQALLRQNDVTLCGQAQNGRALLQMAAQLEPDIIITDYYMPGIDSPDGLSLIGQLARLVPASRLIILTMLDNAAFVESMLKAGAHGIMSKHDNFACTADAISTVLVGRQYLGRTLLEARAVAGQATEGAPVDWSKLSLRELEVMRLYAAGLSITEISCQLNRSVKTISHQKKAAMEKLCTRNDMEFFQLARLYGLIV